MLERSTKKTRGPGATSAGIRNFTLAPPIGPYLTKRCVCLPIMPSERSLFLGEPEAAIAPIEQAIRLAPDSPNLAIAYWALGTCQLFLRRVDQAIDLLQTARAANPRLWVPYLYLAGAYGLKNDLDK